jgi:tetratricopeptide (TPR) repeat protein
MDPVDRWQRVESLFYAALDLEPQARTAFLRQACGADAESLEEAESLLDSSEQTLGFARKAVSEVARQQTVEPQPAGRRVGAYRLDRVLGEGGMGTVYLATRADETYQQQVAIKLMHAGFAPSRGMLLRFRAERQILANLNNPGIARLLDGGITSEGIPYLVMEYVDGLPIDEYCRQHRLSVDARLKLFRTVCGAVEHAHQRLVVHRDIKPGNILVTADGQPKLLDFGIAKLLDPATEVPRLTRSSERLMTPEYASPEQVRGDPITTAADVYALGVLLYELLVGKQPFEMHAKSPLEIAQIICEQDPEPPSRALWANPERSVLYGFRKLDGDLDNIVLMAIRKEPARRYASVAALSADVEAYLTGYSVQARTDTWRYRAGKFVGRHRVAVSLAVLALLVLVGFSIGMGLLARRADHARAIADQQRLAAQREADFLTGIFYAATPEFAKGSQVTIGELLDQSAKRIDAELTSTPDVQATLLYNLANAYEQFGQADKAQPLLERAYSLRRKLFGNASFEVATTANVLAHAYRMGGQYAKAEDLFRKALEIGQKAPGDHSPVLAKMLTDLAFCLYSESRDSEADPFFRKSLVLNPGHDNSDGAITRSLLAQVLEREGHLSEAWQFANDAAETVDRLEGPSFNLAITRHILAGVLRDMGNLLEAEKLEGQTLALWRKQGGSHVDVVYSMDNLGVILLAEGDWKRAEPLLREGLKLRQQHHGAKHPLVGTSLLNWGHVLQAKGELRGAEKCLHQAMDVLRETMGAESWRLKDVLDRFALLRLDRGDFPGGESYARQALEMARRLGGDTNPEVATSLVEVALAREFQGDASGAEPLLRKALEIRRKLFSPQHPAIAAVQTRLGETLIDEGKPQLAEPILREAVRSARTESFPLLPWQVAEPENALGVCLARLGHSAEAKLLLENSREPLRFHPEPAIRKWILRRGRRG